MSRRTGEITLDRPLRSLQQGATRGVNARRKVFGSLWQGRYRAKLVEDQRCLDQLLIYIHLNPVSAGLVDDPAEYPWSGHGEILRGVRNPMKVLGVEGYGLKVRELVATLKKTPDGMFHALARGVRRRAVDERFRVDLGRLDRVIATEGAKA